MAKKVVEPKKYNRRYFIQILGAVFGLAGFGLWKKMMHTQNSIDKTAISKFKFDPKLNVNFLQDYILIKNENEFHLISSQCTHLGCRISEIKNGNLVCPCHGSVYNLNGEVKKGPAIKNLESFDFEIDETNSIITIKS